MLDEETNQIVAFEFKENEELQFNRLKQKRIIFSNGRTYSLKNNLKLGKELPKKRLKKSNSFNR